jgi:hypothetical protein
MNFIGSNIPGCIALTDSSNGSACAAELEPLIQCEAVACSRAECSMASQAVYDNCLSESQMGACAEESNHSAACATDYSDGGVGRTSCSATEGVFNVICGTGP